MSHGHGYLSHPVFWGNYVLLPHGRIARSCLFPYLAMALGTPVCLAVCAEKLCNSKRNAKNLSGGDFCKDGSRAR
ncbi:hypothetical protein GOBAR_AA26241 [Gossypium barbadense]|uniref:Uncharacterized protein n=1 Tax=Gossypium barbadense TaxID=3634 RepID=A0A2P5WTK7_GOSBA|nr:hypothetical protein GOBAR_AA26241 [Gossypium barbadense]